MGKEKPNPGLKILEEAALRNVPLSMAKPESLGKEPMPRGRFLAPENGAIIVENLQVPGRRVDVQTGSVLEAFFQHDGRLYGFRTRVLEMDTPIQLNGEILVRGMKVSVPSKVEAGNRRQIYRQSFASVNPPIDVQVWAVPRAMLNTEQAAFVAQLEQAEEGVSPETPSQPDQPGEQEDASGGPEFMIERSGGVTNQFTSARTVQVAVPGLDSEQLKPLFATDPHWSGEIADASEFGIGLTLHNVVYSRLKVFQPLAIRFSLPERAQALEMLLEVRRVQPLKSGARLGGLLCINARNLGEVKASRDLAEFALKIQRDRVRSKRAA